MAKPICVFILGNGFSQGFGFPSFEKLWDECLSVSSKTQDIKGYFEQGLEKYPLAYFRKKNIRDIELLLSIWSAYIANYEEIIDCNAHTSGRGYYEDYLENLCGHLLAYGDNLLSNKYYSQFKAWFDGRLSDFEMRFITLNYDLVLERMISEIGKQVLYFGDIGNKNSIFIRKLHGSINWLKADTQHLQRKDGWKPPIIWNNGKEFIYNYNADYSFVPYIAFRSPPVIIPPVVNKEYGGIFAELLNVAKADLKKAEVVIMVGYSLPPSDIVIKKIIEQNLSPDTRFIYVNSCKEHCEQALKLLSLGKKFALEDKKWSIEIFDKILKPRS